MVISIQAFIADIGLVANFYTFIADGSLACSYSSCGYAYVFTNLQAIVVHYGLASGYAVKVNILVQSNLVFFATVFIGAFGYSNVVTFGNSGVLLSKLFNIGYTIIKVLDIGLVLNDVCFVLSNVCFILSNVCFVLSDICFVLGYAFIQCCNILIGLIQLAAVNSVSRGAAYFACSYAADLAVLINGNLIVNLNIATVQNDGGSAVGNLVAGYVDICQFCTLISIYAIFGCNSASSFNSTVGTADANILASDIAEKNILIQAYFICLLAILSGFFYSNVTAVDYFRMFTGFLLYRMELTAVYSVSGISSDCTCCYAGNLAVCSNSYFAQLSAFSGDLAVVAACIAYKQLTVTQCGMTGIYAILQNYVADFACSCDYFTVFIYGEVVVCTIECAVAVYEERHGAVFICSTYGQVVFCVQGIGLDGVYTGDIAFFVDGYLTKFSGFRSDLAVVAACIAYKQLTVTQCGMTGIYAILQYYVADFACGCGYFTVFIYVEFIVCCVEIAGTVYKERHDSIFCHSAYGQVVFGVQCVGLNGVYINVFVQLNLNLSAVMAYADVLVTAEINIIAGFYIGCFGCNTVGSEVPAHVSSCTYCLQLAYVYGVCITNACCNTGDTAILVYSYFIVDGCGITEQGNSCAFTVSQFGCCAVQNKACTVIANGFNAYQILVQFNLNSFNAVFCILAYADILVTAEVNIIIGFHIFCFGQNTVSSKFPSAVLQLAYIYSIIVVNACSYTSNTTVIVYVYFTIDNGCITKQFYRCALTISQFGCKTAQCQFSIAIADAFDINQILVQLSLNLSLVIAYADILIAAEINISTGCYINSGSSNTVSGKIPAFICICSYLFDFFQLAYIYSISIINAFSYVGNYFIISIQTVLGDVSVTAKTNAFFIIHEVIACLNAVNIKIFVQFNVNKSSIIGFFLAYGNIFIVTAEVNDITGFNFSRVGDFFPGGKIPACIFSCSLQLCYVYSIGSFAASCYIGNLTSKGSTAYRYSTGICFPGKAICTFRSKSTNNTGFCCSISN